MDGGDSLLDQPGVFFQHLAADHHGHDFLLFLDLPVDVVFHIGVVRIQGDHTGRPAGGSPALDRRGGPIAYLEKGQQTGGNPAPAQRFLFGPQTGVVRPGPGSVLEQPGFAGHQVHDAALVHQVVIHGDDEAVVDQDVVGQVLPTLGLNIVDFHEPQELDSLNGFFPYRGNHLPRKGV